MIRACLLCCVLVYAQSVARATNPITLETKEVSFTTVGSEIPLALPPMIQGREYALDLIVLNSSSTTITPTSLLLSCGCTAATTQTNKAIPPGSSLAIHIRFNSLKIPRLDTAVQTIGTDESDVLFTIRIQAGVQSPLRIAMPDLTLQKEHSSAAFPFRIEGVSQEIDLTNANIGIFGEWVNSAVIDDHADKSLTGTVHVNVPNQRISQQSELLLRVKYLDRGEMVVGEWSFPIRKKTPLSTRMQHLIIDFTGSEKYEVKLLLLGDFDTSKQVPVKIAYREGVVYEASILPSNSRMLLLKAVLNESAFSTKDGEIIVFADDERLVLPFTISGD